MSIKTCERRWRAFLRGTAGVCAAVLISVASLQSAAQTLGEDLIELVAVHKQIKAAEASLGAARERAQAALGGWYPVFSVTGSYGHENQNNFATADTSFVTRELDVSLTQLLWDFGLTNATVRVARLQLEQSQATLTAVRQQMLLAAITAYLNVKRTAEVLAFAEASEANIKRQTELESALVERGAGFSTDVLQAKVQLAGAEARRVQNQGALDVAKNAYRAVFYKPSPAPNLMQELEVPEYLLPSDVEEAVQLSLEGNPGLRVATVASQAAEQTIDITRATEFYPTLQAIGEWKVKKDVAGTEGHEVEKLAKFQLTWPFNLGFTAINTLKASKRDFTASLETLADQRYGVEEQARNAWANYETARENAKLLRNQANIAAEFLELARKERQLGKRSLIDVLAGETALINANSDAISAETDVAVTGFTMLNVMGQLGLEVIVGGPATK